MRRTLLPLHTGSRHWLRLLLTVECDARRGELQAGTEAGARDEVEETQARLARGAGLAAIGEDARRFLMAYSAALLATLAFIA